MHWQATHGDILDIRADVLVCSANIYLTMSGGVGGAFLLRYGSSMQEALLQYLNACGKRHVEQGDIVQMPACGSPYAAVLHAVAVDGAYNSSSAAITRVVTACLNAAAQIGARSVALPLLATGYGHLPVAEFLDGVRDILNCEFPPIERVHLCIRSASDLQEILESLPGVSIESGNTRH